MIPIPYYYYYYYHYFSPFSPPNVLLANALAATFSNLFLPHTNVLIPALPNALASLLPPSGPSPLLFTRSTRREVLASSRGAKASTPTGPNALSEMSSSVRCGLSWREAQRKERAEGISERRRPVKMSLRLARCGRKEVRIR